MKESFKETSALHTYRRTVPNSQDTDPPTSPSTDEWTNSMWYTHTMEYYSVIKNGIQSSVLDKLSQAQAPGTEGQTPHILC